MSDDTRDSVEAHLAYLRQRHAELDAEVRENVKALGDSFGIPDLALEYLQAEDVRRMLVQHTAAEIRALGHGDLADRWEHTSAEHDRAMQEQQRCHALELERPLTASEVLEAAAADTAADEALEQLERVQAAVTAVCTRPPESEDE